MEKKNDNVKVNTDALIVNYKNYEDERLIVKELSKKKYIDKITGREGFYNQYDLKYLFKNVNGNDIEFTFLLEGCFLLKKLNF